ncbi:MAG TPA: RES family NAD+ phosphorylase [Acetobacteraceae bacterium]|nr:RES family NAD+ phosphorylase [Acetobacteraceae bacterium]
MAEFNGSGRADGFPPAVEGWETFNDFTMSMKIDARYFRSDGGERFLQEVLASCKTREVGLPKGRILWRVRSGGVSLKVYIGDADMRGIIYKSRPHPRCGMKPLRINWRSEGRVNQRGISYLYLATNLNTALADVRPWIGLIVSVERFEVVGNLKVIDCSDLDDRMMMLFDSGNTSIREDGIWVGIDRAFAEPVGRDDDVAAYVPTQMLAEVFKVNGYDGLIDKSFLVVAHLSPV